ncbi:DUF2795 domain-containing protein [Dactylosporangium roseum]|uniref:DUF2795 domain-containing protein n=1 Tax=Dactylosporangium roseum TaxID=47989 RepID=A0ABY5ZE44_9ACTN|nr:DUF2795 domain-containing protein [Dactylosporangium roseum]UWZ38579.1 DUF2795 domain-containing protein [Dactylosporangium roseum]
MERGNTKHGVALDDQMRYETAGLRQGGANDPEEIEGGVWAGAVNTARAPGTPVGMSPQDVEARSNLGRYIPKASLPGDRDDLIAGASELNAPDEVLATLERLPEGAVYETVNQVWAALGGRNEDPAHRP